MHSARSVLYLVTTILMGCRPAVGSGTSIAARSSALFPIGDAWAANSVNSVIFRNDPITTVGDRQFVSYYDPDARVIVATRTIGKPDWTPTVTPFTGNVKDAHNSISLIADGEGYLHLSWDHHGNPLRYARSRSPGTADFDQTMAMSGVTETNVSYPQFFQLASGDLLFFFRDGASGRGNLVLNRYDTKAKTWSQVHTNLISGEGQRNAYWQCAVGPEGSIHLSWVWRESADVATNHDLCYARSDDGGKTWAKSDGAKYDLPITARTAEIACAIPQKHELINQTSMCADNKGRPVIATYFRPEGTEVVQYFVIRHDGKTWQTSQVSNRTGKFSLSGGGSKQIPISRPQVLARTAADGTTAVHLIYRDVGANDGRAVSTSCRSIENPIWTTQELTDFDVKYWEPSLDRVRWARDGVLDLYVQAAGQGDGETLQDVKPQKAYVLEWTP
jgi:hypothetical protein